MFHYLLSKIQHPEDGNKSLPFWGWNARLEPEKLRRQVCQFKSMGFGGFFMHARVGLETAYLGEDWFESVRICLDEAKKLGLQVWIYDEDRWPSGTAGGLVTVNHPEYRARAVVCEELEAPDYTHTDDLAWFAGVLNGKVLLKYRRLQAGEALKAREVFLRCRMVISPTSDWYNGGAYLDTCNPEAVREFIRVTYEAYYQAVPEAFGDVIPGIFTDEPNYGADLCITKGQASWTGALPEECRRRFGFELVDSLPELFYDLADSDVSQARLVYNTVLTELFCEAYARQISEWCEAHGVVFTGHLLNEDSLTRQTGRIGDCMRFYEYMQLPGMDLLTDHDLVIDTAKQLASVARQMGRTRRMSEMYAATGWDFSLAGHKALGDWQAACGVNTRCLSVAFYTLEGEGKRDYPACLFHSPWASRYHYVENYFSRLNAALSQGWELRSVLVIHPIESTWFGRSMAVMSTEDQAAEDMRLISVRNALLKNHFDFDYGNEDILARYGSVEDTLLTVGETSYSAVIIPPLRTIRRTTLQLLESFADGGGVVVAVGDAPRYVDGVASTEATEAFRRFDSTDCEGLASLGERCRLRVSICDEAGKEIDSVLFTEHCMSHTLTLFTCNLGCSLDVPFSAVPRVSERKAAFPNATIKWMSFGMSRVYEVDLMSGDVTRVPNTHHGLYVTFSTSFAPLESHLFIVTDEDLPTAGTKASPAWRGEASLPLKEVPVVCDEPNVLVLDMPCWALDGAEYSEPTYVYNLDSLLRTEYLKTPPRNAHNLQPWSISGQQPAKTLDLRLKYAFELETVPEKLHFSVERPELYSFVLNGQAVTLADTGFWCDESLRTLALPVDCLSVGKNTLELHCQAYHDMLPGLENCYLLGEFGVYATYSDGVYTGELLRGMPQVLSQGDWCTQGLRFYSGNVSYRMPITLPAGATHAAIALNDWQGAGVVLRMNDGPEVPLFWPPYEVDVTPWLKENGNVLTLTVLGHRRNCFGQLHSTTKWSGWPGSAEMKAFQSREPQPISCGIIEPLTLRFS